MKRFFTFLAAACCLTAMQAQQLAFPGAVGFGRYATGGRYGSVYHVTNLNDSGAGSLRDAVSKPNRIVVFDVSGVINISSRMSFAANLYVAGQTAPGEGVIVYGDGVSFSAADNIIVRYMKFRMGKGGTAEHHALQLCGRAGTACPLGRRTDSERLHHALPQFLLRQLHT